MELSYKKNKQQKRKDPNPPYFEMPKKQKKTPEHYRKKKNETSPYVELVKKVV